MLTFRRALVGLSIALVSLAAVNCASTPATPATATGGVGSPSANVPATCAPGVECVTVAGDPCNPCGACPGASTSQMTKAEYVRLTEASTCLATHKPAQPPQCSPCAQ